MLGFYFGRELVERKTFDCVACRIKQPKTSGSSLLKFWPKILTENSLRLITNGMDPIFVGIIGQTVQIEIMVE